MVRQTLQNRDIKDPDVLRVMEEVPRYRFVPDSLQEVAYEDRPLPIGCGQTISQPYMVAFMAQAARLHTESKVLEIGTGSGYSAAVLSRLAGQVYSIEILPDLAESAKKILQLLHYENITVRSGDGSLGWPEEQPFDAIVVTAAPPHIPKALLAQLKLGGRMVVPVGEGDLQSLKIIERTAQGFESHTVFSVRFVPMTGQIREEGKEL